MASGDAPETARVFEIAPGLPPDGAKTWYFPGPADHGSADIVARVFREDGSSWIACLPRLGAVPGESSDIFVLPCGSRLFIAGGIVDRGDPESWRRLQFDGDARVSWSPERDVVVFNDHATVEAHGRAGLLWRGVVGSDIGVARVSRDQVVCRVYDWATGREVEQRFALMTGTPAE